MNRIEKRRLLHLMMVKILPFSFKFDDHRGKVIKSSIFTLILYKSLVFIKLGTYYLAVDLNMCILNRQEKK